MAFLKPSRGVSAAKNRAAQRKAAAGALAEAPVRPSGPIEPLRFSDRAAVTFPVTVEPIYSADTGEAFAADEWQAKMPGDTNRHGNAGNDRAALRALLLNANEWGGDSARAAVLLDDGRSFILEGSWAAILLAVPDKETLKTWRDAGVTEVPVWDLALTNGRHGVRWVPIEQAPVAVQVEYESRGR